MKKRSFNFFQTKIIKICSQINPTKLFVMVSLVLNVFGRVSIGIFTILNVLVFVCVFVTLFIEFETMNEFEF